MKVLLDMVISPNGYIAREDGSEDWLPSGGWDDFLELAKQLNNIVMGRETYHQVMSRYEESNFDNVECQYKVIVTRDINFTAPDGYTVVHSPEEAVDFIASKNIETLFLIGGGKLNAAFAKRGLIDELQLTITPYVIGNGRPVFGVDDFDLPLELLETRQLSEGRVQLRYTCHKPAV